MGISCNTSLFYPSPQEDTEERCQEYSGGSIILVRAQIELAKYLTYLHMIPLASVSSHSGSQRAFTKPGTQIVLRPILAYQNVTVHSGGPNCFASAGPLNR